MFGKQLGQLFATDAVASFIEDRRVGVSRDVGELFHHRVGDVNDPVILVGDGNVKRFAGDDLIRGRQHARVQPGQVLHVNQRPPGTSGGLDFQTLLADG